MHPPAFWWTQASWPAALLRPLGATYGAVAARRMARPGIRARVPVVCIGNLTLGGAGKTPAAIETARLLSQAGERPFILSRGYRGRLPGPVLVDAAHHDAAAVGDEPLLLARSFPTVVARERPAGADFAAASGSTVVVMDDGFQNPSLAKDCNVVVVDCARGVGNGLVFPAGPLRAPVAQQMAHAHILLLIGTGSGGEEIAHGARARIPVFRGALVPELAPLDRLRDAPVLAFAGIASPEKFFATLTQSGVDVRARRALPDHHTYTEAEAADLLQSAADQNLTLVTTEKDFVRLSKSGSAGALRAATRTLPVSLALDDPDGFRDGVLSRLRARA
jgi:tetraacyldisaccharide 4'-kinase